MAEPKLSYQTDYGVTSRLFAVRLQESAGVRKDGKGDKQNDKLHEELTTMIFRSKESGIVVEASDFNAQTGQRDGS